MSFTLKTRTRLKLQKRLGIDTQMRNSPALRIVRDQDEEQVRVPQT